MTEGLNNRSRLFDKLFVAAGAADVDPAAAAGHANRLLTLGAAEIAVLLIFQMGEEGHEGRILSLPRLDVPGVHPENANKQQHPAEEGKYASPGKAAQDHPKHHAPKAHGKQHSTQAILALAAHHKITKPVSKLAKHTTPLSLMVSL